MMGGGTRIYADEGPWAIGNETEKGMGRVNVMGGQGRRPGPIELVAHARYHWRAYLGRPERDEAFRRLAGGRRRLAEEVAQAARHFRSLLPERPRGTRPSIGDSCPPPS